MIVEYYRDDEKIVSIKKVEHYPLFRGGMFDFFLCLYINQLFECRGPP